MFLIFANGKDSTTKEPKVVETKQNTSVWIVERNKETHTQRHPEEKRRGTQKHTQAHRPAM